MDEAQSFPMVRDMLCEARRVQARKQREQMKQSAGGSLTKCSVCGEEDSRRCVGCFLSYFCSPDCQKKGWRKHKTVCKETRAQYRKVTLVHSPDGVLRNNQSSRHAVTVSSPGVPSPPTGQFVVKIQPALKTMGRDFQYDSAVGLGLPHTVYNKDRSLQGQLARVEGQEQVYDKLDKDIREGGFQHYKAFYHAIYKEDKAEVNGYVLEINPEVMLPVEAW